METASAAWSPSSGIGRSGTSVTEATPTKQHDGADGTHRNKGHRYERSKKLVVAPGISTRSKKQCPGALAAKVCSAFRLSSQSSLFGFAETHGKPFAPPMVPFQSEEEEEEEEEQEGDMIYMLYLYIRYLF